MSVSRRTVLAATALLASPSIGRAASRRFRLGHNNTLASVPQATAVAFDKALRESTGDRFSLDIVPNSALGSETQMLQAVVEGTLDMTIAPSGTTATLQKDVGLVETLYLFRDAGHARTALDGPLGRHCAELLAAKGVIVGAWSEVGIRHITANKPVRGPADLRGLKIRVPISPAIMESFRAMGAAADELAFARLPEALRTGRFEAQENPINVITGAKLNEFQSHLSLTAHTYTPAAIAISAEVLEELPEADRLLIRGAAGHGAAASRTLSDRIATEGLVSVRAAGMVVVTDIDHAAMRAAAGSARERLAQVFSADAVRRFGSLAA